MGLGLTGKPGCAWVGAWPGDVWWRWEKCMWLGLGEVWMVMVRRLVWYQGCEMDKYTTEQNYMILLLYLIGVLLFRSCRYKFFLACRA